MSHEEIQEAKINRILADNCGYNNVKDWLLGMGLGQYYDLFIENGYDSFRICSEIQKIDIHTIGIQDEYHKSILIKGVKRINNPKAESVYHRLSVSTPDDNELKSLASELNIPPPVEQDRLPNGHTSKLTEDFYKKRPTLSEKRAVRSKLVQLKIDLTDPLYELNAPELDNLAEQIGSQLDIEELSVYDILCLLRGMAINNTSPKPTKHKLVYRAESSNDTSGTPDSPEDVFSSVTSETALPKPFMRPKKPPRAFTNPEESSLPIPTANGSIASPPISITTSDTIDWITDSPYDILHSSDSLEPQTMPINKSPLKMIISTKPDDVPLPPPLHTLPNTSTEEDLYIDLNGDVITENNISSTAKGKAVPNSFFKKKTNSKKQTEDSTLTTHKKPPNQPPPPPPISVPVEVESSGKSKSDKSNKTNLTIVTENIENDAKGKKQSGFFRRSVKPKTETKVRNKKSKEESDVIKESNEIETARPISKVISKSTDNLSTSLIQESYPNEEISCVATKLPKHQGFSMLSQEANEELQKKKLLSTSEQPSNQEDTSVRSLPPNPVPRRRNSPEETPIQTNNPKSPSPDPYSRGELSKHIHTLPRNHTPESKPNHAPKKPKRNISDELIYNNVELPIPSPVPRVRKIDSPPLSAKFDVPNMVLPQRSRTVASRPGHKLTPELTQHLNDTPPTGTGSQVRLKPEVPKGKKPVLKTKPALEGAQNRREKSVSDAPGCNQIQTRMNQNRTEEKLAAPSAVPITARSNSPLTAPPPPTTKRPVSPSSQAPEPPSIHSIPTMRPVAHVRPTKPPIITPPSVPNTNVSDPRITDNWKKIEDKIYSILVEEDFICYLVTHYSRENGESSITPGLVSRLANETSFAIHHIAYALDNIRIQKLTELGKNSVPIYLPEFDEMQTPIHIDTISSWLTGIGLPNYTEVFLENINSPKDIKNLDADDLSEFCISTKHRGYLLHAIEMLQ